VLPEEPRQTAPREIVETAPIELGHLHFAWHIPDVRHPDMPILDVLAALLGHGRSSRLYREVREKQGVVHSVDAWTYSPSDSGLFGMSAVVDADQFTAARDGMLVEIEKIRSTPVPADELGKVVRQFMSVTLSTRKTMQGQAQDLGSSWLAANDLNFSERYLAAVKRVTPAELQRVAREYLTPENRTLYVLLPAGAAPGRSVETSRASEHAIEKIEFANGLRLLVKENHRLPFAEFRAVFEGGVLAETADNNGLTQLMGRVLLKGTRTRAAADIANEIESLGGSIDSYGGNNSFGVSAEVLSGDWRTGLGLLADVILNPTFPVEALDRERDVQIAGVRAQRDHLLASAMVAMRRALFGKGGYGFDPLGSEESLLKIRVGDLTSFHRRFAAPNNCVLAVFGDVNTAEVKTAVEKAFSGWKPGGDAPLKISNFKFEMSNADRRVEEFRDKQQAVMVIGFPGTTLHHSDRYPLDLIQEACSDLGSRLFLRVREELGLAYYVGAQHFPGLAPGHFSFYAGTAPDKVNQVEKELLHEAELLRTHGLTEAELKRAKAKIIGQRKIGRQELGAMALTAALDELYGLGYAHMDAEDALYDAVTLDEVKAVARKYLKPDAVVIAIVKPG
jgi:zinc protease